MSQYLSDDEYRDAYSLVPRLCVDLVIQSQGAVLLTQRTQKPHVGAWHIPGGRVQFRERVVDAVPRISQRELGAVARFQEMLGYGEYLPDIGELGDFHSVSLMVQATLSSGCRLKAGRWFTIAPAVMLPVQRAFLINRSLLKDTT